MKKLLCTALILFQITSLGRGEKEVGFVRVNNNRPVSFSSIQCPCGIMGAVKITYSKARIAFQYSHGKLVFIICELSEKGDYLILASSGAEDKLRVFVNNLDHSENIKPCSIEVYGATVEHDGITDDPSVTYDVNIGSMFRLKKGDVCEIIFEAKIKDEVIECKASKLESGLWIGSVSLK